MIGPTPAATQKLKIGKFSAIQRIENWETAFAHLYLCNKLRQTFFPHIFIKLWTNARSQIIIRLTPAAAEKIENWEIFVKFLWNLQGTFLKGNY